MKTLWRWLMGDPFWREHRLVLPWSDRRRRMARVLDMPLRGEPKEWTVQG